MGRNSREVGFAGRRQWKGRLDFLLCSFLTRRFQLVNLSSLAFHTYKMGRLIPPSQQW